MIFYFIFAKQILIKTIMAKKEEIMAKVKTEDVYFDFENVKAICLSRGVLKTDRSIREEIEYTSVGVDKLKKKAPRVVAVLFKFLKDNCLKIEDVIKEKQQ